MEEVDKIIIHSLKDIGCDIDDDVHSLQRFTTEMVVEAAVRCLDVIASPKLGLSTTLPQSMSARFRVGTTIAETCVELGYNGEIGYQTFLYPTETELRKIFVFLIEKLPKDTDKGASQTDDGVVSLRQAISESIRMKLSGPRATSQSFSGSNFFISEPLETGISLPGQKRDCTPQEWREYCVHRLPFVHEQLTVPELLVPSLLVENARGLLGPTVGTPCPPATSSCWGSPDVVRGPCERVSWVAIREKLLHRNDAKVKATNKVADQLSTNNIDRNLGVEDELVRSEEQRREDEKVAIEQLRERLETLCVTAKALTANLVKVDKNTEKELETFTVRKREAEIRQKTLDLLPNSDSNVAELQAQVEASVQRLISLAEKWEKHRAPLVVSYREARRQITNKASESVRQQETTREMRERLREMTEQVNVKETLQSRLQEDYEKLPKDIVTRAAYTRRIMEIIGNIRKQREEIDKVVRDTKQMQKDINTESGKLERSFTVADELIFRDAKNDDTARQAYKMLVTLHSDFGDLVAVVEETGAIVREIRDLEEQIKVEQDKNVAANLKRITADLRQMRQENASLAAQGKQADSLS